MKRRDFIRNSMLASIPLTLGGFPLFGISKINAAFSGGDNDKILVLVQLQGGNDGLSTIFHVGQYDNLQAVRGNIILPKNVERDFVKAEYKDGILSIYLPKSNSPVQQEHTDVIVY